MNIFKKAAAAVRSMFKRKKVNINKINDAPPIDNNLNASSSFGRGSRYTGYKGETAKQMYEAGRTVWMRGGTGSWARGRDGQKLGRQLPAKSLEEKAVVRQEKRRARKGYGKGCVSLATGLGKTCAV